MIGLIDYPTRLGICICSDSENVERFCGLGLASAEGMDILGNGSVMALGQAGKRWSWGRLYGCGIWHLKNPATSRTKKSYMKKFAPRNGITLIVHDCTN